MTAAIGAYGPESLVVIVVAFHSGAVLDACLEAIGRFVPTGSRTLLVDNSPTDPSAVDSAARWAGVEVVRESSNVGFARAVNDALRLSESDYVLLVNPDVSSIDGSFDDVVSVFKRHPDVCAVVGRLVDSAGTLQRCRRMPKLSDFLVAPIGGSHGRAARLLHWSDPHLLNWDHDDERFVERATGALMAIRRRAFDEVGLFDERFFMYGEETDWLVRAREHGWRVVFTPHIKAVHALRGSSDRDDGSYDLLYLDSNYVYVRKHHGMFAAVFLALTWLTADSLRLLRGKRTDAGGYRRGVRSRVRHHLAAIARMRPRSI